MATNCINFSLQNPLQMLQCESLADLVFTSLITLSCSGAGSIVAMARSIQARAGSTGAQKKRNISMSESTISDDIGRIGEAHFDLIANTAGLLVGKIEPDRVGKDPVIEFKLASRDETVSFDKRAARPACSLQIKTILSHSKVVKVGLAVAARLASSSQPTFICIIRMNETEDGVSEMRLIHLRGRHLEKILKRPRQEYEAGTDKLHEKSITFRVNDSVPIKNGKDGLRATLSDAIGGDMDAYAAEKVREKRPLGYDKNPHMLSLVSRAHFLRPRPATQPMAMRLALPPAAAVLIDVDTSSSSQFRQ
ncbi:hypothetical protein AB9E06_14085 [Rhizobium leguminosarum]|uniref:hypothetical protein n=2 Tax=Rhizobium leguminosarum TaxID=384 RepID=UPI003F99CD75